MSEIQKALIATHFGVFPLAIYFPVGLWLVVGGTLLRGDNNEATGMIAINATRIVEPALSTRVVNVKGVDELLVSLFFL